MVASLGAFSTGCYAVGAVGYYLITGEPVFNASSLVELCQHHVATMPDSPSQRLGKSISPELESALLACLEKSRAKRPQTARDLSILLDRSPQAGTWTIDDAEAWWGRHERGVATANAAPTSGNTSHGSSASGSTPPTAAATAASGLDMTIVK